MAVTEQLRPAAVRVSYPGFWVRDDVWATHGHYLDRHLIPESTFGLPRGRLAQGRAADAGSARVIEYELPRRGRGTSSEGVFGELLERPLAVVLEHLAELTRYGSRLLQHVNLTSVTARALDIQVRRAAVPAMVETATRLGIDARSVIFGHVHRLGPRDERSGAAARRSDWAPALRRPTRVQHRQLGVRADAARRGRPAPPLLARRRGARGGRGRAARARRCSTTSPGTSCAGRRAASDGRLAQMPRLWFWTQVLIFVFVIAGIVIAITHLA